MLANAESAVSAKSKNSTTSAKGGDRSSQERSTKGLRQKNATEMMDEYQQKILRYQEKNLEPPYEDGVLQANFLDDAFGENCDVQPYIDSALFTLKKKEQRMNRNLMKAHLINMNHTKKAPWKEDILNCL
jgi:hypothetical protein